MDKDEMIISEIIDLEAQLYDSWRFKQPVQRERLKDLYLSLGYHLTDEQKRAVLAKRQATQMDESGVYIELDMNKTFHSDQ